MALSEKRDPRQKPPSKQWWVIVLIAIPITIATFLGGIIFGGNQIEEPVDIIEPEIIEPEIIEPLVVLPTVSESAEIALIATLEHWNDTMPRLTLFDVIPNEEVIKFGYDLCGGLLVDRLLGPGSSTQNYIISAATEIVGYDDPDSFEDWIVMANSSVFYLCPEFLDEG